eukprot:CAMPEP_0115039528 /NCGR_PEP_ID=MMETSP0216-20121206/44099_1 /TAXON_ID=223996 /ORGANISM="Protocruzia adherens, Strain Boccale" /LENGTH=43 /DNA_ID= /DNA_START= /DNA_END= /DNA_ORIENTATION=
METALDILTFVIKFDQQETIPLSEDDENYYYQSVLCDYFPKPL